MYSNIHLSKLGAAEVTSSSLVDPTQLTAMQVSALAAAGRQSAMKIGQQWWLKMTHHFGTSN